MFKKLIILSTIAVLGGCETINQASQCDPDKNYISSNPQAMEEYKKLLNSSQVKSYYFFTSNPVSCENNECIGFETENFTFVERNFNDPKRNGIYTIRKSKEINNENCIKRSKEKEYCFFVEKNKNQEIKSNYKISVITDNEQTVVKMDDIGRNVNLYTKSYQVYITKALGGPGFGTCEVSKNNNKNYNFNYLTFYKDKG